MYLAKGMLDSHANGILSFLKSKLLLFPDIYLKTQMTLLITLINMVFATIPMEHVVLLYMFR